MSPYVEPNPDVWPPGEPILYDLVANIILDATAPTRGGGEDEKGSATVGTATGAGAASENVSWIVQLHDKAMSAVNARREERERNGEPPQRGPEWLEIQDLYVNRAESETLFTREGYLMVWERRKFPGMKKKGKSSH
jgi:U4/U6.U5 tri-snRNP-associated protein 2